MAFKGRARTPLAVPVLPSSPRNVGAESMCSMEVQGRPQFDERSPVRYVYVVEPELEERPSKGKGSETRSSPKAKTSSSSMTLAKVTYTTKEKKDVNKQANHVCSMFCYKRRGENHDGSTPELMRHLHERGKSGESCLHLGAQLGHLACISRMLSLGADPRWKDKEGNRPDGVAKAHGHGDVFRALEAKALMMND